jgi:hypothetical protein
MHQPKIPRLAIIAECVPKHRSRVVAETNISLPRPRQQFNPANTATKQRIIFVK